MTERRYCKQCGCGFSPKRPHAEYDSEECRYQGWIEKQVEAAQPPVQRVKAHPLAEARAEQEATDLKSKLSQIIYEGIIDRLKRGPVHADDLEPLFADEVRDVCRRLVGAQFGSLASRGYIKEVERRKSKVPTRKSAKSGVYVFTAKGRAKLVGIDAVPSSGDGLSRALARGVDSGENQPGGSGADASPSGVGTGSPDQPLAGHGAGGPLGHDGGVAPRSLRADKSCVVPGEAASGVNSPAAPDAPPDQLQRGRDRQVRGAGSGVNERSAPGHNLPADSSHTADSQPARLSESEPLTLLSDEVGVEGPKSAFTDVEAA